MKKLIAVAMLLSTTVCTISSCEDQTEAFDSIQSQPIEDAEMKTEDGRDGSGHDPEAP